MTRRGEGFNAFEKGDIIFNSTCHENEVALDKRDTGGFLWGVANWSGNKREKLHGQWFKKCPANAALYSFFQRTEVSSEPMREQEEELRKRMRLLFGFARLVSEVVAEERASLDSVTRAWCGKEYDHHKRGELEATIGTAMKFDEASTYSLRGYPATVSGLPFEPKVTVAGPKQSITLKAPKGFDATDCCNYPHSCCEGHR